MILSIIIPVYNTEKYISWCLDSCLNINGQINDDYEIICVNDGSTDNSIEILKQYENKGVRVFSKLNGGVSSARNFGLGKAQAEYVWFIDSDDMIVPNSLQIIKNYQSNAADVLKIQMTYIQANTPPQPPSPIGNIFEHRCDTYKIYPSQPLAWNTIVKRSYLLHTGITFNENVSMGEDTLYAFWLQCFKNKWIEIPNVLYLYRQHSASMTKKVKKDKHCADMLMMAKEYNVALNLAESTQHIVLPINHIRERIFWASQNVIFDALFISKEFLLETIDKLKKLGFYPFPYLWKRIIEQRSLKMKLLYIFRLPLCYPWYCKMIQKIILR